MQLSLRTAVRRMGAVVVVAAALSICGCGNIGKSTVSGRVEYFGKVLKGGNVTFVKPGYGTASGPIKDDGTYTVAGVPLGTVKVCVETKSLAPKSSGKAFNYTPPKGAQLPGGYDPNAGGNSEETAKRYVKIPDKYGDPEQTDLTLEVTGPTMTYDILLK